jgi:glucokinase
MLGGTLSTPRDEREPPTLSPVVLVAEVGGTNLRTARFDPVTRTLLNRRQALSPSYLSTGGSPEDVLDRLLRTLSRLGSESLQGQRADVVSVAYPGPIDRDGDVLATPTVLGTIGISRFPLRRACARLWPGARILVMNDLTATGYRYTHQGMSDFCVLTIGSGVGHKVFVEGQPLLGPHGRGGEIGHLRVDLDPDAVRCDCGEPGHLGGIASGRGSERVLRRLAERDPAGFAASMLGAFCGDAASIDSRSIVSAFTRADPWVRSAIQPSVSHLGHAIAAIHLIAGVERFLLVGGFAFAMGDRYRQMIARAAETSSWRIGQDWDQMIEFGIPDDDQGMMGAGIVALDRGMPELT